MREGGQWGRPNSYFIFIESEMWNVYFLFTPPLPPPSSILIYSKENREEEKKKEMENGYNKNGDEPGMGWTTIK